MPNLNTIEGVFQRIQEVNNCWVWIPKGENQSGHKHITIKGKHMGAHRLVYKLLVGELADDLVLDHLCNNPPCVNPDHLNPCTQKENLLRSDLTQASINKSKTSCINGHLFAESNTYIKPNGARNCKKCLKEAAIRYSQRKGVLCA